MLKNTIAKRKLSRTLYHSKNEHDACGVGFVAHLKGKKSQNIIEQGLMILKNLDHRGAVGADPLMGDGAGILIQLPDQLYREDMKSQGVELPPFGEYGVGMVFLPREEASRMACQEEIQRTIVAEGQILLGWRDVPVEKNMKMSAKVKHLEPVIRQVFVGRGPDVFVTDRFERKLYVIRKKAGHAIQALKLKHGGQFYVSTFSARTICYKGLLLADQIGHYFKDLLDPRCVSAIALVHHRFSTNTFPTWDRAHPFRFIAHNGEINTLRGNVNWLRAREQAISSPVLGEDLKKIWPLIYDGQSDSASFDNALELLVMAGYPLAHAMMMMIPEAWEKHQSMNENRRAFYEYHAALMEPWDGPAAVAFTDGRQIGATLDRNGLRPARYCITSDDLVILASEAGVLKIDERKIIRRCKLEPGKMLLLDLDQGRIVSDSEIKDTLARSKPYREWISKIRVNIQDIVVPKVAPADTPAETHPEKSAENLESQQIAFGYTQEELLQILKPMAQNAEEPTGSMGNDTALSILSKHNKTFYSYFRQLFAQVTNPPIDPLREDLVMSLNSYIGPKPNLLNVSDINPPIRLEVAQPILNFEDMNKIRHIGDYSNKKFSSYELNICYPVHWGHQGIEARLASLCAEAEDAVRSNANILIISDRRINAENFAIPALLATSAVHQQLVRKGLRTSVGLVVETGSARQVHHFATLASYGAEAVHPYLALKTVGENFHKNYIYALGKGLRKIMSKMGISTYRSYTGAQVFEAIGLQESFVNQYFTGTSSQIEGIGIFEVAEEALRMHRMGYTTTCAETRPQLALGGELAYRAQGEDHMWTPDAIAKLQKATRQNNFSSYQEFAQLINEKDQKSLRGLLKIRYSPQAAIPLDEVEAAKDIVKRFNTGAMSLGSISTETHASLAIAMNRLGGKSNTGEGGEDPKRYKVVEQAQTLSQFLGADRVVTDLPLQAGDSLRSAIKQVASGRFGVTVEYLTHADQIQIKIAQGAKPGEGGQLPGHKVSDYIAYLRHSTPGVGLISPPPHHDIYSIEDLAQLIYDLRNVNPEASISVKLVAEGGVGTVAAGVAKCKADHIVVSGHDGGTGASPLSSIYHAGLPWELGLAETQQTLTLNNLRSRVKLQVDGQLKTGRDVVIGALLGADEFGFATAPLITQGCIMMRKCHLNTCPVGVATQDPDLRKKFTGRPEFLINYFFFVAEEVRQIMAKMGIRKFDQLIGQTEYLEVSKNSEVSQDDNHWKTSGLDFEAFLAKIEGSSGFRGAETKPVDLDHVLDKKLIQSVKSAVFQGEFSIKNTDRSVGAMLSGYLARQSALVNSDLKKSSLALGDASFHFQFTGTAGQSLVLF